MEMVIHKLYHSDPDYVACDLDHRAPYSAAEDWEMVTCPKCNAIRAGQPKPVEPSPMSFEFNVNDEIVVTLTKEGQRRWEEATREFPQPPDENGVLRVQAWYFFNKLGTRFYNGGPNMIVDNRISIPTKPPSPVEPPKPKRKATLEEILAEVDHAGRLWDSQGQPFEIQFSSNEWVTTINDIHSGLVLIELDLDQNIVYVHDFWEANAPDLKADFGARKKHEDRVSLHRMIEWMSWASESSLEERLEAQVKASHSKGADPSHALEVRALRAVLSFKKGQSPFNPYVQLNLPENPPEDRCPSTPSSSTGSSTTSASAPSATPPSSPSTMNDPPIPDEWEETDEEKPWEHPPEESSPSTSTSTSGRAGPKIVSPPEEKHVKCRDCKATIAYLPEHVEEHHGTDYGGGPDGYERVKCPRPGCPGHGYIRTW